MASNDLMERLTNGHWVSSLHRVTIPNSEIQQNKSRLSLGFFQQPDWDYILDSLYIEGNNDRLLADIIIDGNQYDSVGVRYKGFSSVSVNYVKNPFNIKLDYIIEDQDHEGIDKLKLSNVIQDPSFVREVLSYEIARKYMPSPEGNYANLYINDTLWGLYTNIEAINKKFLSKPSRTSIEISNMRNIFIFFYKAFCF